MPSPMALPQINPNVISTSSPSSRVRIAGRTAFAPLTPVELDSLPVLDPMQIPPLYEIDYRACPMVRFYKLETFKAYEKERPKVGRGQPHNNDAAVPGFLEDGYGRRYNYDEWQNVLQSTREVVVQVFGEVPPFTLRNAGVERIRCAIALLEFKHVDLRYCEEHYKAYTLLESRVISARGYANKVAKREKKRAAEE